MTGLEFSAPRVYGTTQKAQNLSQPSWTVKKAEGPLCADLFPFKTENLSSSGKAISTCFLPSTALAAKSAILW